MKTKIILKSLLGVAVVVGGYFVNYNYSYARSQESNPKVRVKVDKEVNGKKLVTMDTSFVVNGSCMDQLLSGTSLWLNADSMKNHGCIRYQINAADGIPNLNPLMEALMKNNIQIRGCDTTTFQALMKEVPNIVVKHLNEKDLKIDIRTDIQPGDLDLEKLIKQLEQSDLPAGTLMDKRIVIDSTISGVGGGNNPKIVKEVRIVVVKSGTDELTPEDKKTLCGLQPGLKEKHINTLPAEDLNVYPNPSQGIFRLSFSLPEKERTSIRVMDMQGKVVYTEQTGDLSGRYEKDIDLSAYPKGAYFLEVRQGKATAFRKLIMQ